jgi:hypothetical protein
MEPLEEELVACLDDLVGDQTMGSAVFAESMGSAMPANGFERPTAANYSTWIPEFSSYYSRVAANNPELLTVDNPGGRRRRSRYNAYNKGGATVARRRRTRRRSSRRRSRSRNKPMTVRHGKRLLTYRALVKKYGVRKGGSVWRKGKKHHGRARRSVTPWRRKRSRRKAANPRRRRRTKRRSRRRARNTALKVAFRGQKVTKGTLRKRMGRGYKTYWAKHRKYHYGKSVNPRRRRRKRRSRRRFRRRNN